MAMTIAIAGLAVMTAGVAVTSVAMTDLASIPLTATSH